jgi:hypothetical protein
MIYNSDSLSLQVGAFLGNCIIIIHKIELYY